MSRQKQMVVMILCTSLILCWLGSNYLSAQERERTWTSSDRSMKIRATLTQYDPDTGLIELTLPDGTTRWISHQKVSPNDRRYLSGYGKRKVKRIAPTSSPKSTSLFGIDWVPTMSQALQLASGKTGTGDDRPVMCFRVLGDLQGPM